MRRTYDQHCPVARSLDLVGERWTLLLVRDLFGGPLRFVDMRRNLPDLAPNLLAERLRQLEAAGIVERVESRAYALTARGRALRPVVVELARWGLELLDDPDEVPFPEHLWPGGVVAMTMPELLGPAGWTARLDLPTGPMRLAVRPLRSDGDASHPIDRVRIGAATPDDDPPDIVVRTTLGALLGSRRDGERRPGALQIRGDRRAAAEFAALFGFGGTRPADHR